MKKFLKTALAAVMVLSMAVPALAAPAEEETEITNAPLSTKFSDINTDDYAWARPYIDSMADAGYISGYEDGTYRPDNDMTRLETISLFARAMGSTDKANKQIVSIARDKYESTLKSYNLPWGSDDIAFMMYKGALKKSDLDTYLKDDEKNTPMKRYEAAIIITKAMGGEKKALGDLGVVLDYTDAREVPSSAIQYVSYATDQEIMTGMGDGEFSPNTPVKRSQMSVMLSKTVEKMDYTFMNFNITSVDTAAREIKGTDNAGETLTYNYTDDTAFMSVGNEIQAKEIVEGTSAVITLAGDDLVAVDITTSQPDKTVTGKYVSYASTSGKTTIRITPDETGEAESYEVSSDVSVSYDGSPATIRSFTKGDVITLELHDGQVVNVIGGTKSETIVGAIIEDIKVADDVTITISHANSDYNGKSYKVASNVTVKKNDAPVDLDAIYKGDKVNLTLEYDEITKIVATSTRRVVEGTIASLTIASPNSTMKVKVKGEEIEYTIPKDVTITINGEEGTLYDFRVGDSVKITTDSDAITRIVATTTQESSGSIVGVVTSINTSYGVVSIKTDDSEDTKQVFCKDDSTMFVTAGGKTKKMKDVKAGQTVEVKGVVSNGVFVGTLFVIISE